uniref:Organic solute transporter alpha-like protein n=1 Tax=Parascaris univalens TaxID=6257 RepID=A0A915ANZ6_PARUN
MEIRSLDESLEQIVSTWEVSVSDPMLYSIGFANNENIRCPPWILFLLERS